jgi:hypothetical protein
MTVCLVLVRTHRPDRLERQQVVGAVEVGVPVLALEAEKDEFALPPGDGRRHPPFGVSQAPRRLHPVVAGAEHPAPGELGVEIHEGAIPIGRGAELGGMEPVALGPERDLAPGARFRRPVGQADVEPREPAPKARVVIVAAGAGDAELRVGRAVELPEVLQPEEQRRLVAAGVERVALGGRGLGPDLVGAAGQRHG